MLCPLCSPCIHMTLKKTRRMAHFTHGLGLVRLRKSEKVEASQCVCVRACARSCMRVRSMASETHTLLREYTEIGLHPQGQSCGNRPQGGKLLTGIISVSPTFLPSFLSTSLHQPPFSPLTREIKSSPSNPTRRAISQWFRGWASQPPFPGEDLNSS